MFKDKSKLRKSLRKILGIDEKTNSIGKIQTINNARNGISLIFENRNFEDIQCIPKSMWETTDQSGYNEYACCLQQTIQQNMKTKSLIGIFSNTDFVEIPEVELDYGDGFELKKEKSTFFFNFLPKTSEELILQENKRQLARFPNPPSNNGSNWGMWVNQELFLKKDDIDTTFENEEQAKSWIQEKINNGDASQSYKTLNNTQTYWISPIIEASANDCLFDYTQATINGNYSTQYYYASYSETATNQQAADTFNAIAEEYNVWYDSIKNRVDTDFFKYSLFFSKADFLSLKTHFQSSNRRFIRYQNQEYGQFLNVEYGIYQYWLDGNDKPQGGIYNQSYDKCFIGMVFKQPTTANLYIIDNGSMLSFGKTYGPSENDLYLMGATSQSSEQIAKCTDGSISHWTMTSSTSIDETFVKTRNITFGIVFDENSSKYKIGFFKKGELFKTMERVKFSACMNEAEWMFNNELVDATLEISNENCCVILKLRDEELARFDFQGTCISLSNV